MHGVQNHLSLCGLLLTGICLWIRYAIGRRRFNRRGIAGLQQFRSYRHYVWVTAIEQPVMLIANLCGLAGVALLVLTAINHFKF